MNANIININQYNAKSGIISKLNIVRSGVLLILFFLVFSSNIIAQVGSGCSTIGKTTWGTSASSVTNLSTVLPSGTLTNTTVVVNGTLNVDLTGFTIQGSQLLMQSGSVINLTNNSSIGLYVDNSEIIGCGIPWQGIKVFPSQNASISILNNSTISDAVIAVEKAISNNATLCHVNVSNSHMSNNQRCISMGGRLNIICYQSIFDGGVNALDLFDFDDAHLIVTQECQFNNQTSISIKVSNSNMTDTDPKIGTITIRNSFFMNTDNSSVGIDIDDVFYNNRITGNTFTNFANAIIGRRTAWYIKDNFILFTIVGIDILEPRYFGTFIDNNTIQVSDNSGFPSFCILVSENIQNQPLTIQNNPLSNYNTFGIRLINGLSLNNDRALVYHNNLNTSFRSAGIEFRNVEHGAINNNNIIVGTTTGGAPNSDGILVTNGGNNTFYKNTINTSLGSFGTGIRVNNSSQNTYKCNTTNNTRNGFNSSMTCANSSLLYNTFGSSTGLVSHNNGLQIDNFSQIGIQSYRRNTWESLYSNLGADNQNINPFNVLLSQFIVETPLGTKYHPTNSGMGFFDCPIPKNVLDEANCMIPETGGDGFSSTSTNLERMISNTTTGSPELNVMDWEGRRYSYGFLSKNPSYLNEQTLFSTFYTQNSTSNIGKFQQVQDNWTNASSTQPYSYSVMDALRVQIEAGFDQSTSPSNLATLVADYYQKTIANKSYLLTLANQELSLLDNIQTSETYEQNLKNSYKVYFSTLAKGIHHLNADEELMITNIANLCPLSGGSGVFNARAIYNQLKSKTFVFENSCSNAQPRFANNNELEKLSVSPNPANDRIEIKFSLLNPSNGKIQLVNTYGQILDMVDVSNSNQISLNISDKTSGMYFVRLIEDGKITQIQKVFVVK